MEDGEEGSEAVLRVQISKLKKLGLDIINQRAVGYKLEELWPDVKIESVED